MLDRFLAGSTVYPTDYGYLIGHRGKDGDALDCLVCVSEPTFPGCVIRVKPIALFKMEDEEGVDDKVICVPCHDPGWNTLEDRGDITDQLQNEISHFFSVYKDLEEKKVDVARLARPRRGARGPRRGAPAPGGARRGRRLSPAALVPRAPEVDCRRSAAPRRQLHWRY